jgi:AraC-like DNA-binding protein
MAIEVPCGPPITRTQYTTTDAEAAHEFLGDNYGRHRVVEQGSRADFTFSVAGRTAGKLDLTQTRHSAGTTVLIDPIDYLLFANVTRGNLDMSAGREQARAPRGGALLFAVGTQITMAWDCVELYLLNLPLDAVAETAAAQTGIAPGELRFESMAPTSAAMARFWRGTVGLVSRELAAPDTALAHPLVQASTISMLAAAALSAFPNTAMNAAQLSGPGRVAPVALRRAVAFIDAHADQPIGLADVAAATDTSARALQHAFKRHHGTSPLGYLNRVRLERAHHELQAADPTRGDTVTAIAHRWGFANPGRFATLYRQTYGHLPSHTLRT